MGGVGGSALCQARMGWGDQGLGTGVAVPGGLESVPPTFKQKTQMNGRGTSAFFKFLFIYLFFLSRRVFKFLKVFYWSIVELTMLCYFQMYSKVIWFICIYKANICIYPFFFRFFSHMIITEY